VAWYCHHAGYNLICSTPGATRVDLEGGKAGTVTQAEARDAAELAKTGFEQIEARKQMRSTRTKAAEPPVAPTAPTVKVLKVDTTLDDDGLVASIESHLATFKTLRALPDPALQRELSRPVLLLLIDELKTLDARLSA
jgi:sRNA-binding protein